MMVAGKPGSGLGYEGRRIFRKYRIRELATGRYAIEVNGRSVNDVDDLWVPASKHEFSDQVEAALGIVRIIEAKCWYYDEAGNLIDEDV